jgi:hypothetical protein
MNVAKLEYLFFLQHDGLWQGMMIDGSIEVMIGRLHCDR